MSTSKPVGPIRSPGLGTGCAFRQKKTKAPLTDWYALANELKVIVYNDNDFAWAEEHAARCVPSVERFLQPEWSRRDAQLPKIIDYLAQHPEWRLGLQTHKYIGMP